jgi:hypothetical protein
MPEVLQVLPSPKQGFTLPYQVCFNQDYNGSRSV